MKKLIISCILLGGGCACVCAQTYKPIFSRPILLGIGSAAVGVTLQADPASSPFTLQLPIDDGTPNQVLTTDGNGVLSWATPAGGGGSYINNQTTQQLSANFNIDGTGKAATFAGNDGTSGSALTVRGGNASTTTGGSLLLIGGTSTSGAGGSLSLSAGTSGGTAAGGTVVITASNGSGTNQNGGTITLTAGDNTGSGTNGFVAVAAGKQLRLNEPSGSNYNSFQTAAQSVDVNYTLPTAAPAANGNSLTSTTGGALSWGVPVLFFGGFGNNIGNNEVSYSWINEHANHNPTATNRQTPMPVSCTIREMHVVTNVAPGGTTSVAFDIFKVGTTNNSDDVTISGTNTVSSNTNMAYSVTAGDILVVRFTSTGDPANNAEYRYIITATIP